MNGNKLLTTLRAVRGDQGFAVPTALMTLMVAMGIVAVGVMSAVSVQRGATRDQGTKSALPQAEAGVAQALLHFNRISGAGNPCAPVTATGPGADGWCAPVTGGFDNGTFTYQVYPGGPVGGIQVVSTGTHSGASRRVHVSAHSSSGQDIFRNATMLSREGIHLDSEAQAISGVSTNGDITLDSNASICGTTSVGIGRELILNGTGAVYDDPSCTIPGSTVEDELVLPPVNQGSAATTNDNGRFFALDRVSGNKNTACWNGFRATGQAGQCGTRELDIGTNSSVTLGGGIYSMCKLTMNSNSALFVAAGVNAIIYFDSPEECGYTTEPAVQLDIASNARMTSTDGNPVNLGLLFVGSTSFDTLINLRSNTAIGQACEQNAVIYAPRTDVVINSNSTHCGAVAAKTIELDSEAIVLLDVNAANFVLPNAEAHYEIDRFVECRSAQATPPDAGC